MAGNPTTDGKVYGSVNQSTKTQSITFQATANNFSAYSYYWNSVAYRYSDGTNAKAAPYNTGSGLYGWTAEWPNTSSYEVYADGTTAAGYYNGDKLDCDKNYMFRAEVGGDDDGSSPDAYRYGSWIYFKTYAISVTAPTISSSSVLYTTATITCDAWYANTADSTAYAYLEYKRQADSTYTQAGAATASVSGYSAQASFSRNLTGLSESTTYQYRLQIVRTTENETTYTSSEGTFSTGTSFVAPTFTTSAASSITSTTATLNGTCDPNSNDTGYHFAYGTASSSVSQLYGDSYNVVSLNTTSHFPCNLVGHSSSADSFSYTLNLTGLSASTTYYFRAGGIQGHGTGDPDYFYSAETSFTTSAPPAVPEISTSAASSVGGTTATLNGSVDPNGVSTTYYFQWGTTTGYGSLTADQGPSSSSSPVAFSAALTGLSYSTTYHFRAVAVYSGTTIYGSDYSFTTGTDPAAVAAAEAAVEEHVRTIRFDGKYATAKDLTFVLYRPAASGLYSFYKDTAPVAADLFLFKDGAAASWSGTPAITRIYNPGDTVAIYKFPMAAADMDAETIDVIIHDATATPAFRDCHLQIRTKMKIGQVDIDATGIGSNTHALPLTSAGSGSSIYCYDDITIAGSETLTIGGNMAVGVDLDIAGALDVVGNIETDAALAVTGNFTAAGAMTITGILSAASIGGITTSMTLNHGVVSSAVAYTVTLPSTASSVSGTYVGGVLAITAGTGVGQSRIIESYEGSNRTCTINRSWSTLPSSNSTYVIYPVIDMWTFGPTAELTTLPDDPLTLYTTGTVSVTNGTKIFTFGGGATLPATVKAGDLLVVDTGVAIEYFTVATRDSDTQLTSTADAAAGHAGVTYSLGIHTTFSEYRDKLQWLYQRFFFPREQDLDSPPTTTALTFRMFLEDGATTLGSAAITDAGSTGGTHTIAKLA